jgi:hypothetical protein
MAIGLSPTKEQLDATAGDIARAIFYHLRRAENLKYFLDAKATGDLEALGYDESGAQEVTRLKSAVNVLDELRQIFEGEIAHAQADMRTFPRQIAGMGDV